jgi:hypothetical protein
MLKKRFDGPMKCLVALGFDVELLYVEEDGVCFLDVVADVCQWRDVRCSGRNELACLPLLCQ